MIDLNAFLRKVAADALTPPAPIEPIAPPAPAPTSVKLPPPAAAQNPLVTAASAAGHVAVTGQPAPTPTPAAEPAPAATPAAQPAPAAAPAPAEKSWKEKAQALLDGGKKMVRDAAGNTGKLVDEQLKIDAAKAPEQGIGEMFQNNWQAMLLPIGLMMMFSGNNVGKTLGVLAMAGGAYNLHGRYKAIKDPKFQAATMDRAQKLKLKQWSPEDEQGYQATNGAAYKDLGFVSKHFGVNVADEVNKKVDETLGAAPAGSAPAPAPGGEAPPSAAAPKPTIDPAAP